MAQDRHQNSGNHESRDRVDATHRAAGRATRDVRPNTPITTQHTSGARPKTSVGTCNTGGARPKTSRKSRRSSQTQHDSASASVSASTSASTSAFGLLESFNANPLTLSAEETTLTPPHARTFCRQYSSTRPRHLLNTIPLPADIHQSPTVCAVEIHLRDDLVDFAVEENQTLLKTAIRAFLARTGQLPKAAELLEDIIDSDFQEENVVKSFADWGLRQFGGVENVPVFHRQLEARGGGETEPSETSGQRTQDGFKDGRPGVSPGCSLLEVEEFGNAASSNETADQSNAPVTEVSAELRAPDVKSFATPQNNESEPKEFRTETEEKEGEHLKENESNTKDSCLKERLEKVLKREREYLRRKTMCSRCDVRQAEVTFLPCTHIVTCSACAAGCSVCPLCGGKVLAEAKTFLV